MPDSHTFRPRAQDFKKERRKKKRICNSKSLYFPYRAPSKICQSSHTLKKIPPSNINNLITNPTNPLTPLNPPYNHPPHLPQPLHMRPPTRIRARAHNLHDPHPIPLIALDPDPPPPPRLLLAHKQDPHPQVPRHERVDRVLDRGLRGAGDQALELDRGGARRVRGFCLAEGGGQERGLRGSGGRGGERHHG